MVGVTTPIVPHVQWLQVTAGVGLEKPRDHWYVGLSLARLRGIFPEGFPLDIHALAHVGRIQQVRNPGACEAGTGTDPCATDARVLVRGGTLMLSIDGGTLLTEAIRKLGS